MDDIAISGCATTNGASKSAVPLIIDDGSFGNMEPDDPDLEDLDNLVDIELSQSHASTLEKTVVYANPFEDSFTIHLPDIKLTRLANVKLYDVKGKLVYERLFMQSGDAIEVKTEQLQKGMYTLKIQLGNDVVVRKMLKQ